MQSHLSPLLSPSYSLLSSLLPSKSNTFPPSPTSFSFVSHCWKERERGLSLASSSSFSTFSTNSPSSSLTPWWGEGGETLLTPHPSQLSLGNSFSKSEKSRFSLKSTHIHTSLMEETIGEAFLLSSPFSSVLHLAQLVFLSSSLFSSAVTSNNCKVCAIFTIFRRGNKTFDS